MTTQITRQATIQRLRIQNYRVLRDVEFRDLTPLTVLLGPNGSGKSTVFDVFAFLHEAFTTNLRAAWDHRNRIRELRSRGANGPITIEIAYRQASGQRLVTYRLELDEENGSPVVVGELLRWSTSPGSGRPRDILSFQRGAGSLYDDASNVYSYEQLDSPDLLAVSTLGGLARHPRVANLRRFISGWYLSYLSGGTKRTVPEAGPQARLSETGDNLPNVVQYLSEQHPARLRKILRVLAERVPQLERVDTELLADGRLLLAIFCRCPTTQGAVGPLPGWQRFYSDSQSLRYEPGCHASRRGWPAREPVDGGLFRGRRSVSSRWSTEDASQRVNLEILVEELSAERALGLLLPRIVPGIDFDIHVFRGKTDLLKKLPHRLKGYANWITREDTCLVVLVDCDDDECLALKADMEQMAAAAGLSTATAAPASGSVQVLNRIAVEELEAWFFVDVPALCAAYPRLPDSLGQQAKYRDPDAISGGTWEALERVPQKHRYHRGGLAKVVAATDIAQHMNVEVNRSRSFQVFRDGVRRLVSGGARAAQG